MDSNDMARALMAGDTFSHRPIGLYPSGARLLEEGHLPTALCDPALAHSACFHYSLEQGKHESIHFSIHGLDGEAPDERRLGSWTEMLALWRRRGSRLSPRAKDPLAHLWTSGCRPESDAVDAPLALDWGIAHTLCSLVDPGKALRVASEELATGLIALCGEGWLAVPLGKFEGPDRDHIPGARAMARERLALALSTAGLAPRSNGGPRL